MSGWQAVVFDFDGLIVETEEAEFLAWHEIWAAEGVELTLEEWAEGIGGHHGAVGFHPVRDLQSRSGRRLDESALRAAKRARMAEQLERRPVMPGVLDWLEDARRLGLGVAIASSSPRQWIEDHLARLGLTGHWPVMACFDDCGAAKPDPASYRMAVDRLGADPRWSLAVEDSRNGMLAAVAAGLRCVVAPTRMTAHLDFSEADFVLPAGLAEVSLPEVLARLAPRSESPGGGVSTHC